MGVFSAAERLASVDRSAVKLDQSRCLHSIDKFSKCEDCFNICPVGAITRGSPPSLVEDSCATCLACLPACPLGAYTADDAVPALLNCVARVEATQIELLCENHSHPELIESPADVAIRVRGCLAGLGMGAYLALIALELERVIVRVDACQECAWGTLQSRIKDQVQDAQRLLLPWELTDCLHIVENKPKGEPSERPMWDANNPPLSRRDLFRMATRQGAVAAARAITSGSEVKGNQPGRDRLRVINAMGRIKELHKHCDSLSLEGLDFVQITVTEECTACGVCAHTCPTSAITFTTESNESYVLSFLPQNCVGCEVCLHVCAVDAIRIDHQATSDFVFLSETPILLQEGDLVRCQKCNTHMAAKPGERYCTLCDYRLKNPFGSVLPPALKRADDG